VDKPLGKCVLWLEVVDYSLKNKRCLLEDEVACTTLWARYSLGCVKQCWGRISGIHI